MHTDASVEGLGVVLYQEHDGLEIVDAYGSMGLCKADRNYSAHKLEFLCLKRAVTNKFHDYLYGNTFSVYTNNNPLTYVLTSSKLDATGHRWIPALGSYDCKLIYRSGKSKADADGLYLGVPSKMWNYFQMWLRQCAKHAWLKESRVPWLKP